MPTATRLFMSGPPRSSAGMPMVKNRRPGPARTMVVRTNWISQLDRMPMLAASQWWKAGTMWPPISRRKTGRVRTAASISWRRGAAATHDSHDE